MTRLEETALGRAPRRQLPNLRWWIVAVLFCGSLVNYLDRVALSIVAPQIRTEFRLSSMLSGATTRLWPSA